MRTLHTMLVYAALISAILTPVLLVVLIWRDHRRRRHVRCEIERATERTRHIVDKAKSTPPVLWVTAAGVLVLLAANGAAVHVAETRGTFPVRTRSIQSTVAFGLMTGKVRDYPAALNLLTLAAANGESPALVARGMVECHRGLENYALADEWADRLGRMPGEYPGSLNRRGVTAVARGDRDAARRLFTDAAQLGDSDAAANLGFLDGPAGGRH